MLIVCYIMSYLSGASQYAGVVLPVLAVTLLHLTVCPSVLCKI